MINLDSKSNMTALKSTTKSPALPDKPWCEDTSTIAAYEHYLHLPELSKIWKSTHFTNWRNESILKPALQALEITFRLISISLSDPRPYSNHREWSRRLESLSSLQIELIAVLSEKDADAPITDLSSSCELARSSSQEIWKLPGASPFLSRTSAASLLPRLAAWDKSEDIASRIQFQIETQMRRCHFTLGLGEPNLTGKPNLEYDLIVQPSDLHSIKKSPMEPNLPKNHENQVLFTMHQILESWIFAGGELLCRIEERIEAGEWDAAASDCWILERFWKLLSEVEDLVILMDPDDLLRLKSEISIGPGPVCFRSVGLMEMSRRSRDLRRRVPWILGVEVDLKGGPRVQEAAMGLFHGVKKGGCEKVHLLQGFQAVEGAVKRFYFGYRQVIIAVVGSLEATGNRGLPVEGADRVAGMFIEPAYFPSLDAAKTFLGGLWQQKEKGGISAGTAFGV